MKTNIKKFILAVLFVLLLVLLLSCQSNGGKNDNIKSDAEISEQNQNDTQNIPDTTEERIYPDLKAVDFGGYGFTVIVREYSDPIRQDLNHRDIYAEEMNGDVINDAVYIRNRKIEEKYNISIRMVSKEDPSPDLRKAVGAGDDIYDVFSTHLMGLAPIAQSGNLLDLFQIPNLDLKKPWWNQGCVRDMSVMRKLFIVQGDLLTVDNDAMEAMIFNKIMLKDYGLESPYDIVKKGEWTFDRLIEMSKGIAKDLNGDGQMYITDDLFGCIIQADTANSFFVSGGEKIAGKDENDLPVITFGSERGYKILDAVSEMNLNTDEFVNLHRYDGKLGSSAGAIYNEQDKMMTENRALFSWIRMRVVKRLRAMETDFGIIPCPKLDKNQDKYITHNNPHAGVAIGIPVAATDLERTGTILEDLCAESRYTLQPAYYELNLRGKFLRDAESEEMLDIILNNTAYDIGYIYNFGGFSDVMLYYGRDKKTDYASAFEKAEQKMQKDIDKVVAAYEKLN